MRFISIAFLMGSLVWADPPSEGRMAFKRATKFEEQGEWARAEAAYIEVIKKFGLEPYHQADIGGTYGSHSEARLLNVQCRQKRDNEFTDKSFAELHRRLIVKLKIHGTVQDYAGWIGCKFTVGKDDLGQVMPDTPLGDLPERVKSVLDKYDWSAAVKGTTVHEELSTEATQLVAVPDPVDPSKKIYFEFQYHKDGPWIWSGLIATGPEYEALRDKKKIRKR